MGKTTSDPRAGIPALDFSKLAEAETPEFGSQYAKDYWDIVFEQLGKRWLFKLGMAILTVLYGIAAFAPMIANDKPYFIDSVDVRGFTQALRVSPMAGQAAKIAALTDAEYDASIEDNRELAPPTRLAKVQSEYGAVKIRVATMRSMLPEEETASLDPFVAAFEAGLEKLEAGDSEAAVADFAEAKTLARALRKDLKPLDPDKPESKGIALNAFRDYPLLKSVAAWEIFFMALWVLWALWPVWNRVINSLLLRGNRDRIRAGRKIKVLCVLGLAVGAAAMWHGTFGAVAEFDNANYKRGLTNGSIVLLAEGKTTADLVSEKDAPVETSSLIQWAPVPFGFSELHEDEVFRQPTWTKGSERDPETGRPMSSLESEESVTGVIAESSPVEVRVSEPKLNSVWRHPLGTDASGRDILSRMIWGARISLSVGILSAILLTIIGVTIGSIAGFFGGRIDDVIMRGIEILQSIPALFLILLALAFTPPGTIPPMFSIVIVIAVVRWTGVARLVRGEFLRLREQEFVVASRALGFSSARTIFRHVLPNAMSPVLVAAAFSVAAGILTESAVSFLGLGIKEPQASWGGVVNESKSAAHWWIQIFPGLAIFVTVTCYNLVGDAIRDAMDPKMKV